MGYKQFLLFIGYNYIDCKIRVTQKLYNNIKGGTGILYFVN